MRHDAVERLAAKGRVDVAFDSESIAAVVEKKVKPGEMSGAGRNV